MYKVKIYVKSPKNKVQVFEFLPPTPDKFIIGDVTNEERKEIFNSFFTNVMVNHITDLIDGTNLNTNDTVELFVSMDILSDSINVPISVLSVSANGNDSTPTTELTVTFDNDPESLGLKDIVIQGATPLYVSGTGNTRIIGISDILFSYPNPISLFVASPIDYTILPKINKIPVYSSSEPIVVTYVDFLSVTANGSSTVTTTNLLTLNFDVDPIDLDINQIELIGATRVELTGTGTTRQLSITNITVTNGNPIAVTINNTAYLEFTPNQHTVNVYVEETVVEPEPDTEVSFVSLTANGISESETTSHLTATFDVNPSTLSLSDYSITGASIVSISGTGLTRSIEITNITVTNNQNVILTLSNPNEFNITPLFRSVPVYIAVPVEPDVDVSWLSLTANGEAGVTTTTELTATFSEDPGALTVSSFTLFNANITSVTGTGTTRVLGIDDISDEELTLVIQSSGGYVFEPEVQQVSVNIADTSVPITITSQPTDQTVDEDTDATFSVTATSDNAITYQWFQNGVSMSGETASTLTLTSVQEAQNANTYYCVLNNGSTTAQTNTVTLSVTGVVDSAITISSQPANRTVTEGQNATFTVFASSGLTLSYQWKNAFDDSNVTGETSASLTIEEATLAEDGYQTYCTITNSSGSVNTNTVTLSVFAASADVYEPTWISDFTILPQDGDGWTIITPASDSRIMYVSAVGSDATGQVYAPDSFGNFLLPSGENAFATLAGAYANVRSGFADIVLLRRGDKFSVTNRLETKKGRSLTERHIIADYGNTALAKPIVNKTSNNSEEVFRQWKAGAGFHRFQNIKFTWDRRNPSHASFDGFANINYGAQCFYSYKDDNAQEHRGIFIEGCEFSHFVRSGTFNAGNSFIKDRDIIIRRNTVYQNYKQNGGPHPQGWGLFAVRYLFEENITVQGGWANYPGTGSWNPTIFSHSTYSGACENSIYRNNISIDPSSIHNKHSATTENLNSVIRIKNLSCYGNTYIGGEVVASLADNKYDEDLDNGFRGENIKLQGETAIHVNEEQFAGRTLAWGYRINDTDGSVIEDCIMAHVNNANVGGTNGGSIIHWQNNALIRNNVAYNMGGSAGWASSPDGRPATNITVTNNINVGESVASLVDPDRDLFSYMVAEGIGNGTNRNDYINGCLNYWVTKDARYSPYALRDYIRAGFSSQLTEGITVVSQPTNKSIVEDENTSFTFSVISPSAITYQWFNAATTTALSGETAATLSLTNVQLASNGNTYYCVATPAVGDAVQSNTVTLTVTEVALNPPIASGTFAPPVGQEGGAYSYATAGLFTGGTPTSYAVATGTLPAGITLNTSTGLISGTPTTEGTATGVSISATNADGSDTTNTASIEIGAVASAMKLTFSGTKKADISTTGFSGENQVQNGGTFKVKFSTTQTGENRLTTGSSNHISIHPSTDTISVRHSFGATDTATIANLSTLIADGNPHTLEIDTTEGIALAVIIDGVTYPVDSAATVGSGFFLRINDLCGPTNTRVIQIWDLELSNDTEYVKFNIDSGSTTTEEASVGTGTLTFENVVSGDWA